MSINKEFEVNVADLAKTMSHEELITTLGINTMTNHTPLQPLSEELFDQQNEVMAAMHDYE